MPDEGAPGRTTPVLNRFGKKVRQMGDKNEADHINFFSGFGQMATAAFPQCAVARRQVSPKPAGPFFFHRKLFLAK
jgi:hypothetical protein